MIKEMYKEANSPVTLPLQSTHKPPQPYASFLFFPALYFFQYKSQQSAGAHMHILWFNVVQWVCLQLVQCGQLSGQHRNEWICCGRKRSPAAVPSPRPYRWQGAGGRQWRPVTAPWAARRWAIIAGTPWLSVPLSTLRKFPLFVQRDIFLKGVHVQQVWEADIKDRSPGRFSNLLFIREVLDTEINTVWEEGWKLSLVLGLLVTFSTMTSGAWILVTGSL